MKIHNKYLTVVYSDPTFKGHISYLVRRDYDFRSAKSIDYQMTHLQHYLINYFKIRVPIDQAYYFVREYLIKYDIKWWKSNEAIFYAALGGPPYDRFWWKDENS